ncbi:MAG: MTH938/NDUFAF3 family protein [Gammaproteobacteria bacterium]|jgi:uncharacterized protein|nr:MTH938/NDUFAF3 family protein [Gammaproteobacteria bacterium]MDP6615820.1 MTH938/NDUFAF3 family protein [Gammaproteobacteria bacterium]MDP6694362.1 MTH938/NDUFAF3 family protein [Gammaproteobacteria bacterium]MDP7041438.1 MTH938/NDUFAF3 family protein [Gammaproteobacteria bacterium]
MKFTADSADGNVIRSFSPGEIRLHDKIIDTNVIISRDRIIADWNPPDIAEISLEDFRPALGLNPDIILFGTGINQHFPDIAVLTEIMRSGVAIEVMETHAACRTFNVLIGEHRAAVAALLVG